ncbi:hypothetical protein TNCV_2213861 [Trichonephila clavipes]|nr:hypothetical protein TNCV_2213861 [Trichonephila clavipes]
MEYKGFPLKVAQNQKEYITVNKMEIIQCSLGVVWVARYRTGGGRGSRVVKVSDRGWFVTSSSPVPLKTRRVGERCTLHLSRAETSSRWCGEVVRRGGAS